jgi:hypothetical protein
MRFEALSRAGVYQQRLEHVLDPLRGAENSLHAGAPSPAGDHREIARTRVTCAFAVDSDRHPRREVRLADQQLAAAGKLDDDRF